MVTKKDRLEELESKIEDLSKRLRVIHKALFALHENLLEFIQENADSNRSVRKMDEKWEKYLQFSFYYRGLVMGLILGILGNLFVSLLMKPFEIFNITPLSWVLAIVVSFGLTLLVIWLFSRRIKNLYKEASSVEAL